MGRYDDKKPFKVGAQILLLEQEGGCDYTLGCGVRIYEIPPDAPYTEFVREKLESYSGDEYGVVRATVLVVTADVTGLLDDIRFQCRQREKEDEREEKRRQIERLRKELGE